MEACCADSRIYRRMAPLLNSEWQFGIFFVLAAAGLGIVLWGAQHYLETYLLDRYRIKVRGEEVQAIEGRKFDPQEYWNEWFLYVDSLRDKVNPYIAEKEALYFCATRGGLGIGALGMIILSAWGESIADRLAGAALIAVAGLFYFVGVQQHEVLADHRRRVYGRRAKELVVSGPAEDLYPDLKLAAMTAEPATEDDDVVALGQEP